MLRRLLILTSIRFVMLLNAIDFLDVFCLLRQTSFSGQFLSCYLFIYAVKFMYYCIMLF